MFSFFYSGNKVCVLILMFTYNSVFSLNVSLELSSCYYPDTSLTFQKKRTRHCKEISLKVKEVKAIYPVVLKGNEIESINYIKNFSIRRRNYIIQMYNDGKKLLPKTALIFKKYKLPEELKILLTLECAYDSNVISPKGAVGYWQMLDEVAKEYGLDYTAQPSEKHLRKIFRSTNAKDSFLRKFVLQKDERKVFIKSTHAAAQYLKNRYRNLDNNILLVVASYNFGVGNVWELMAQTGKKKPTFWDIKKYLPYETQTYVMNFISLNVIFNNYDYFIKKKLLFTIDNPAIIPPKDLSENISLKDLQ